MLNKTPIWKYLLIIVVIVPGILFALPNIFGDDPGLQIRATRGSQINGNTLANVESVLASENIVYKAAKLTKSGINVRFNDTAEQLKSLNILRKSLGSNYTQALSLLPSTPAWLGVFDAKPMYLGLDLRGGVHFLMEVDTESILNTRIEDYIDKIRSDLRDAKARFDRRTIKINDSRTIDIGFRTADDLQKGVDAISENYPEFQVFSRDDAALKIVLKLRDEEVDSMAELALDQNISALRNRIDQLGVAEPLVQRQGTNRIVVQLPGVQDTARAKEILGKTATLQIKLVNEDYSGPLNELSLPSNSSLYKMRRGGHIVLKDKLIYSGQNIVDAGAGIDSQNGLPIVTITLDADGARTNSKVTKENIGKRMAVIYNEVITQTRFNDEGRPIVNEQGNVIKDKTIIEEVITAPVIRSQLGARFQIEGLDGIAEAKDLSLLLRAGAFAAPIEIIEERTVGPSLGRENIRQGVRSVLLGLALVLIFMIFYYRKFGFIANLALIINLVLLIAVLSLFQATLTLPGVAGIVLTVGMAVDANVLIFERIREELNKKTAPQMAIHKGYEQAFSTILDANITTLIAALLLFNFGTGPIKGFAVTLSIGIVTSMFTAIILTRTVVNWLYGRKKLKSLSI